MFHQMRGPIVCVLSKAYGATLIPSNDEWLIVSVDRMVFEAEKSIEEDSRSLK